MTYNRLRAITFHQHWAIMPNQLHFQVSAMSRLHWDADAFTLRIFCVVPCHFTSAFLLPLWFLHSSCTRTSYADRCLARAAYGKAEANLMICYGARWMMKSCVYGNLWRIYGSSLWRPSYSQTVTFALWAASSQSVPTSFQRSQLKHVWDYRKLLCILQETALPLSMGCV